MRQYTNLEKENVYRTIASASEGIYKEKGSKFIAIAVPCRSEEEAKTHLESWRKEHYQSRHVCYAYRFGAKGEVYRANDDGEPANSAGQPILGQLLSFDVTNVLIGVVRYFGGTKLGVGGLITAYKTATKEALEAAEIVEREVLLQLQLDFPYAVLPQVMSIIKQVQAQIDSQQFDLDCRLLVSIPPQDRTAFLTKFELLTDVTLTEKGTHG